jgi:hypothetical protein
LIRDLAKHLSPEKRQGFLRGQLGSLGKQSDVLLREQFVDSSAEEEARKRRKFGTALARDLESVKEPRLVMAALRKTLKVDESLASRAHASLQKEARAGKSGENGAGPGETWLRMTLDLHSSYVALKPDDLPLVAGRYLDAGRMVQLSRWLSDAAVRSEGETVNRLYADFSRLYGDDRSAFDEVGATWASFCLWGRYYKLSPHPTPAEARQRMTQKDAPAQRLGRWLDLLPEFLAEGVGKVVAAPAGNDALGEVIGQLASFLQALQGSGS